MATTLQDIAARAGVSVATVSFVASGKAEEKHISKATEEKVRACMNELNYNPKSASTKRRNRRPSKIVIVLFFPSNLSIVRLMENLSKAASDTRTLCEIMTVNYSAGHLKEHLWLLEQNWVSGAIIGATSDEDLAYLESQSFPVPIVLLDRQSRRYSSVSVNSAALGLEAAVLIHNKGYKSCAVFLSEDITPATKERFNIFLTACKNLNIAVKKEWTYYCRNSFMGGAEAIHQYLSNKTVPKMLYFENDIIAQGGIYALLHKGVRIPKDIEIISCGHIGSWYWKYHTPSLTCITVPDETNIQAFITLLRMVQEKTTNLIHTEIEPEINIGDTFIPNRTTASFYYDLKSK